MAPRPAEPAETPPARLDRVLVYGATGSGKSTCAGVVAQRTGLPLTLVDELCWEPGWTEVPRAEQRRRIAAVVAGDRWVIDSVYADALAFVLPRVDLVICLDYPRWLSLQRLVRRSIRRVVTRERVCNGNVEQLWRLFTHDSIILWHFRSFARKRSRMRAWAAAPEGPPVLLFPHPHDLDAWLTTLDAN